MSTLIRVPNYGHFDIGGDARVHHVFDSPYDHKLFCELCHRMMPDGFYTHLGMKHCPWCGTEFVDTVTQDEPVPHPLILEENERRQAERRKDDLERIEKYGCPNCLIPLPVFGGKVLSHKTPVKEEGDWNPHPEGEHYHRFCSECDYEQVSFMLTDGAAIYSYNPNEPTVGPLAGWVR